MTAERFLVLIDTNVWSELTRRSPEPRVSRLLAEQSSSLFLSTIVLSEIEYGIAKALDPTHRERLMRWLDMIVVRCGDRVLAPDFATAAAWGKIKANLKAKGEKVPDMDLLIAAQAIAADMPLATRNVSDMGKTGAVIINPWAA